MEKVLLLDSSISSLNRGDDIIMECVRKELGFILKDNFELTLPTQVAAFHWYQIVRGILRIKIFTECKYKFVGGTNLLATDMFSLYPTWDMNVFDNKAIRGCVLVGVGAGAGEKMNAYTKWLYRKTLNHNYYHSARDERTRTYIESLGLKALNTGCVTMWMLTPEFCKTIPTKKANRVVFTLTANRPMVKDSLDQELIDTLKRNYSEVYYWVQGDLDYDYLQMFDNIDNINILPATKQAYHELLMEDDLDYVGTRLHAGVYAMRHRKRSIILVIDERAREINKSNNLNCLEKKDIKNLDAFINSEFATEIKMPLDIIEQWKNQFRR